MKVSLGTYISEPTYQALEEHSKATGKSKAAIVEAALREYMAKKGDKK